MALFDEAPRKPQKREVRALVTPRSELRPLYLNTPGLRVGKSGTVLQIKDKEVVVQEARIVDLCQVNLMGNIQISTQSDDYLGERHIAIVKRDPTTSPNIEWCDFRR